MLRWQRLVHGVGVALACSAVAAERPIERPSAAPADAPNEVPIVLSPFAVNTARDRGYDATNAISATRLDTAIKDVPFAIEVITSHFINDIGAATLREALTYSAGIQLQSQNDYTGNGLTQYRNPGGVNNPEMQTGNASDTVVVIRGFTTESALRDGFRRKVATDVVNLDRIEVIRGPAALLYGVGNFGGVVNYLPKTPGARPATTVDFAVGSDGYRRATFDFTTPLAGGRGGVRLTGAAQENGDGTEFHRERRAVATALFTYRPWLGAEVTVDAEYARGHDAGIGFQSIRARADAIGNDGRQEHAGFVAFAGRSLRTMRWSGPDTFRDSRQGNLELKLTQRLREGLDLLAGYNHSSATFDTRDVSASVGNNIGPVSLWSTLVPVPLDATRGDTDANWAAAPMPHAIVASSWSDTRTGTRADQGRVELSWRTTQFPGHRWIEMKHSLLAGASCERDHTATDLHTLDAAAGVYDWKSVADPAPFRYSIQGDGTSSLPLRPRHWSEATTRETAGYLVYQGRLWQGRATIFAGIRTDRNGVSTRDLGYRYADGAVDPGASSAFAPPQKSYVTRQLGISVSPLPAVALYALRSEGLSPNFAGARDLEGRPMDAVRAVNHELGLKFDLWHGRVSGTISRYRITRMGQPNASFWWAPQTATRRFDPSKPVVYNVTDLNPDAAQRYFYRDNTGAEVPLIQWNNNYAYWGDLSRLSDVPAGAAGATATEAGFRSYRDDGLNPRRDAIVQAWTSAKASGAVSYWDATGRTVTPEEFAGLAAAKGPPGGFIMLNASRPEGAAYLDAVYDYVRAAGDAHPGSDNWPGWFFNPAPAATGYNSAALDTNSFANTPALSAAETDRNTGWDGQLRFTPDEDWQVVVSFEKNNHEILSLGRFPDYPAQQLDRWAPWMFPNGQWGLAGFYGRNRQYTDENRTSTFSFQGMIYPGAQGMDYPRWSWSVFLNHRLRWLGLPGLRVGGGAIQTGPQEYESGYTHAGDALKDGSGRPLILETPSRWTMNVFARYELRVGATPTFLQLNVDNVLDDKSRFGLLWMPGRSVRVRVGASF
jgi:outer membrane receptor protein involved in Fe transport